MTLKIPSPFCRVAGKRLVGWGVSQTPLEGTVEEWPLRATGQDTKIAMKPQPNTELERGGECSWLGCLVYGQAGQVDSLQAGF